MDQRRAAGALLALVVCVATTAAAPTVSNQTGLDLYDSSAEGCYYNFQHYGEGDRIMTNEPCLNCTCHNRMLMCYLRVCPFTKPIGQDCTVEKRADQCCPIVTCPDVPVDLLTSTTTSPAEYGGTGVGKLDKYGCSINGKYFPEGSKVPPTPNKPCEHCYCIRNMTTCVMQECTLHVDGCTPIYHKDVCCPVRYSCDHPEDETLLLDDMTTTVRPTPGFLLTTTTLSPVTQMTQDCVHDDQIFPDGALIKTEKACEHCYCMKGDIVCVVQECGTPMENEGKNCTSQPPREGQCCPDTYICEGDEITTEPSLEYTTLPTADITTRRVGIEGSGYRNEPDEPAYTEVPLLDTEPEGSGYEQPTEPSFDGITPGKESPEVTSETEEELIDSVSTSRTPTLEEIEKTTEPDKGLNTVPSDDDSYKPAITDKATTFDEEKITEAPLAVDDKQDYDKEKTTVQEDSLTTYAPKIDESSSTTESVFRKEDGEPTETYDVVDEKTTSQPATEDKETTLAHDEEVSGTKAPFMEEIEKQTIRDDEPVEPSQPVTEPTLEVSTAAESKPTSIDITTASVDTSKIETTPSTIDKIHLVDTTNPDENEVEDITTTLAPARIPGEGDCLLNEITYRNNSEVPSYNACDTGCKCISSIVKCDRIICSPPPDYMDNCQPTYDPPGSCCPTYDCHTGETKPPQPHSQMSGTEKPVSTVECHGDECEINKDKESSLGEKPIISECTSAECHDQSLPQTPEKPIEKCDDGKCLPPSQECADGKCEPVPVEEPVIVPVKDVPLCDNEENCKGIKPEAPSCHGEGCSDSVAPVGCSGSECGSDSAKPEQPHCDNEEDCKKIDTQVPSCEGEGCTSTDKDCSGPECSTDISQPTLPEHDLCKNDEECKTIKPDVPCEGEECTNVSSDCNGPDCSTDTFIDNAPKPDDTTLPCTEKSCRRKETGEVDAAVPAECNEPECLQQQPAIDDGKKDISLDLPITEQNQDEITTSKQGIQTELPEDSPKDDKEIEKTQTASPVYEDLTTTKYEISTQSEPIQTSGPIHDEEQFTKSPELSQTDENLIGDVTEAPHFTDAPGSESDTTQIKDKETEDADQTTAPHEVAELEPTEGPKIQETQTTLSQESLTEEHKQEEPTTKSTMLSEEGLMESSTSVDRDLEKTTEPSVPPMTTDDKDVTKVEEESKITVSPGEQELITKSPTFDDQDAAAEVTEPSSDVVDKTTEEPKVVDETKITTESSVQDSQPSLPEQPITEILSEETTKLPEYSFTTSSPKYGTDTSEDEIKSEITTVAYDDHKQESITKSPESEAPETSETKKPDEGFSTPQEAITNDETTQLPVLTEEKDQKTDVTSESPDINEVEHPDEKTESPVPKFTEPDAGVKDEHTTKTPFDDNEVKKPETPDQPTETEDSVTEEQEISTEEPSLVPSEEPGSGQENIPSEEFIPVHTEAIPESTAIPVVPTQTPMHDDDTKEDASKVPETPDVSEYTTEQSVSEPVDEKEPHKDDEIQSIEKQTTEHPEDFVTKEEVGAYEPQMPTTLPESVSESTDDTLGTKIKDGPEDEKEYGAHTDSPQETTQSSLTTTHKAEIDQGIEDHVTDSDMPTATDIPQSHVKDPETHDSETPERSTEINELVPTVPQEVTSPVDAVTETLPKEPSEKDEEPTKEEEKPFSKPSDESTESPQGVPVEPQDVTKPHLDEDQNKVTEEPLTVTTIVPELPKESSTDSDELPHTEVREPDVATTESPVDEVQEPVTEKKQEQPSSPDVSEPESTEKYPVPGDQAATEPETQKEITTEAAMPLEDTEKQQPSKEPIDVDEESTAKPYESPISPSEEITTEPSYIQEPTIPDLVELEEHSHKPMDEITTISPVEEDTITDDKKSESSTEKVMVDEDNVRITTETYQDSYDSTSPSSGADEQETPVSTTKRPAERLGEVTSQEEPQSTVSGDISVQTERITTQKQSEVESPEATTAFEDLIPVTAKIPESAEHTKQDDKPVESTEKPLVEPEEIPVVTSEDKPEEVPEKIPTEKPAEEPETLPEEPFEGSKPEHPLEEPIEKPVDEPTEKIDEKPMDTETVSPVEEPSEEPAAKPEEVPMEEPVNKPDDKPTEETTEKTAEVPTEEEYQPEEKPSDTTGKPAEETTDKPQVDLAEEPAEKPSVEQTDKPEVEPTEKLGELPTKEPTPNPEEKPLQEPEVPAKESTEKPLEQPEEETEHPAEKPTVSPTEKLDDETTEKVSIEEPSEEPAEKPTEKPEEGPLEEPTEAPVREPTEIVPEKPEAEPTESVPEEPTGKPSYEATEKPAEQPIDEAAPKLTEQPGEEPTEKPLEEPTEKPVDEPTEKPVEEPTDKPVEEPTEKPVEEPFEATEKPTYATEEPVEEPAVIPTDVPAQEPMETPAEEPIDKPVKETPETPAEEATDKPAEEATDKPTEEVTSKPAEEATDKPSDEATSKPAEEATDKPADEVTSKPAEEATDKPADEATSKPAEVATDKPADEVTRKPAEEATDKPAEEATDKLTEEATDKPAEEATDKPAEEATSKPAEEATDKPTEEATDKPAEDITDKPSEEPIDKPIDEPTRKPTDEPVDKPAEEPVDTPAEKPTDSPLEEPVDKPAEESPEKPYEVPTEKPSEEPTGKPEETPVKEPSETPAVDEPVEEPSKPSKTPEETPETEPTEKAAEATTSAPIEEQKPMDETEKPADKPEETSEPAEKATERPEEHPQEKPEEKPQDVPVEPTLSTAAPDIPKPGFNEVQPTDEVPDDFPTSGGTSGYGTEPDYVEEDQAFGPGTCRYGGKVYVSAQQIPRDDPCDFCFCFRSDIICLQQSCPPPIHGCHEEPIQGFCCPRYECPVAMATTLNVTTTTTTTTTTLPPHFLPHAYKGAAQRRGCQIKGHTYKVGEVVRASSGPCLHCTCGGDGQMKCDPKACTPEPMLRQMIAAAVSAKRRR